MHRLLAVVLAVFALVASSCGRSESSSNLVPIDDPAPGVLYVSTAAGDIQVITPASEAATVFVSAASSGQAVVDIAVANGPTRLQALVQDSGQGAGITAVNVAGSGFEPIDVASNSLTCLDPHGDASVAVAHEAGGGDQNGVLFDAVAIDGGTVNSGIELVSVACPRWSADRDMVATAVPTRDGDPSSITTVVQTSDGVRHQLGFSGCGSTPTSFSPDDQFLTIALTCYSAAWESSGLYLAPVADLGELGDLDQLTKVGSGLFGRTAWHPDGEWLATMHADAVEKQNIAVDLSAQPVGLQAIELETLQTIDLTLAGGAEPFSVAWLDRALS